MAYHTSLVQDTLPSSLSVPTKPHRSNRLKEKVHNIITEITNGKERQLPRPTYKGR